MPVIFLLNLPGICLRLVPGDQSLLLLRRYEGLGRATERGRVSRPAAVGSVPNIIPTDHAGAFGRLFEAAGFLLSLSALFIVS